ncbi:hypothetical protein ACFQFH_01560 [Halobaculum halobium]|uniref:hypothetical protein n=1 Tax=Halobaculum halobium TaxID=3032281 RepID=UPI00360BFDE0
MVVDDHQLQVRVRLVCDALDGLDEELRAAVGGNHDGDPRGWVGTGHALSVDRFGLRYESASTPEAAAARDLHTTACLCPLSPTSGGAATHSPATDGTVARYARYNKTSLREGEGE